MTNIFCFPWTAVWYFMHEISEYIVPIFHNSVGTPAHLAAVCPWGNGGSATKQITQAVFRGFFSDFMLWEPPPFPMQMTSRELVQFEAAKEVTVIVLPGWVGVGVVSILFFWGGGGIRRGIVHQSFCYDRWNTGLLNKGTKVFVHACHLRSWIERSRNFWRKLVCTFWFIRNVNQGTTYRTNIFLLASDTLYCFVKHLLRT